MKPNIKALAISTSMVVCRDFRPRARDRSSGSAGHQHDKLAPDLSFSDDSSPNFPIAGKNLSDCLIAAQPRHAIFFGTANCWNTGCEAECLANLILKTRIRFTSWVVDLRSPSARSEPGIARYYRGYIPAIAVIDSAGQSSLRSRGRDLERARRYEQSAEAARLRAVGGNWFAPSWGEATGSHSPRANSCKAGAYSIGCVNITSCPLLN